MRIAIAGGTGTLGRHVVDVLRARGHDVRVLSRTSREYPVDLKTGEGLDRALEGCHVVVDASNDSSKRAAETLVEGSRRLLAAEAAAEVSHHVGLSIIGCEVVPGAYSRVKVEQEKVIREGPVAWSIVRSTQFHELVASALESAARWRILPVPHVLLQTVASVEVARVVADVATGTPRRGVVTVAGPDVVDARTLAREWRSRSGRRVLFLPLALPGRLGRALRSGALTAEAPDVRGTMRFATWWETTS